MYVRKRGNNMTVKELKEILDRMNENEEICIEVIDNFGIRNEKEIVETYDGINTLIIA